MNGKVEAYCMRQAATRNISVDRSVRACINCIWYEQHFRLNRGNIKAYVGTHKGHCILYDCDRGPLRQPCKKFEPQT